MSGSAAKERGKKIQKKGLLRAKAKRRENEDDFWSYGQIAL